LAQIFISHSKLDKEFCDRFDTTVIARVEGIKGFRSEFEEIWPPAWKTIRDQMNRSVAMFLLIGKELVKMQDESSRSSETAQRWKYTQNWIAYEVGLACQKGIHVWVLCDDVLINFPIPYFTHYEPFAGDIAWLKGILDGYARHGPSIEFQPTLKKICPNNECKMEFIFWGYRHAQPFEVPCPQCLHIMKFGR